MNSMNFNPGTNKEDQEIIFSRKTKKRIHLLLLFNNANVNQTSSQKHLAIILDTQLKFEEHLKMVSGKTSKTIALFRKFQNLLPRTALITIYKTFIKPRLDYGDILYDQACLINRWKIGAIQGTFRFRFRVTPVTTLVYKKKMFHKIAKVKVRNIFLS